MRIVVHHSTRYEFHPVPPGIAVEEDDKLSGRAKPDASGTGWLMRVPVVADTETTVCLSEATLIHEMFHDARRSMFLSRKAAAGHFLHDHMRKHHSHPRWVTKIEVHDDGPDEALARAILTPHVAADTIDAADLEAHIAAYLEPADAAAHVAHMSGRFKVKGVTP